MLMTAGLGTRLRPITQRVPKALVPVMGIPVAQFSLDLLKETQVSQVICNLHHLADQARAGLEGLLKGNLEIGFTDESTEILGSAGGVRKALDVMKGEQHLALNADVMSEISLKTMIDFHQMQVQSQGVELTLAVYSNDSDQPYSEILIDPDTSLVTEIAPPKGQSVFFGGQYIFSGKVFRHLDPTRPADLVSEVLRPLIRERKVAAFPVPGRWFDVGSPYLWWQAHIELIHALEEGSISQVLRERVEKVSKRIAPLVWVSRRSSLSNNQNLKGPVYLDLPVASPLREACVGPNLVAYHQLPGREALSQVLAWNQSLFHFPEQQ